MSNKVQEIVNNYVNIPGFLDDTFLKRWGIDKRGGMI